MAALVTQTKRLFRFFGEMAQRLYDARLERAERDVSNHRVFLGEARKRCTNT
jgi:hypothetical protein